MNIRNRLLMMLIAGLLVWPALAGAVTLDEAVAGVRADHGGRVLSAETRNVNGRRVHYIRILTNDGRVRQIRVNAGPESRQPQSRGPRR